MGTCDLKFGVGGLTPSSLGVLRVGGPSTLKQGRGHILTERDFCVSSRFICYPQVHEDFTRHYLVSPSCPRTNPENFRSLSFIRRLSFRLPWTRRDGPGTWGRAERCYEVPPNGCAGECASEHLGGAIYTYRRRKGQRYGTEVDAWKRNK